MKFSQDVFDVTAYRADADAEQRGNFPRGMAVGQVLEDFPFPPGQHGMRRFRCRVPRGVDREVGSAVRCLAERSREPSSVDTVQHNTGTK